MVQQLKELEDEYHNEKDTDENILDMQNKTPKSIKILDFVFGAILSLVTIFCGFVVYKILAVPTFGFHFIRVIIGFAFSGLTFGFLITGLLSVLKIKIHFPKFYNQHKFVLLFAVNGLTFSLMSRAVLDLLYHYSISF